MCKRSLLILLFLGINCSFAQVKRALQPTDVYRIPILTDPQLSPDGKWVAYVVAEVDTAKDKRTSKLWMQSWDGKEKVELTHGTDGVSSPRWSPDGKYMSFVSARESKNGPQIWLMDRRGGEGKKLTDYKGDINEYAWSPDGSKIVLAITEPENNGKEEPKTPKPLLIDRYHFKQDVEGYLDKRQTHLYVFNLDTKKTDTLTRGNRSESSPAWSPDGMQIAFVSNITAEPDRNSNTDIFIMDAKAGGKINQLTTWKGNDESPLWSPDGKYISYLRSASDADYMMYDNLVQFVMDSKGGHNTALTAQLDRPADNAVWSKDSKSIAFLVSDDRKRYVSEVSLSTGKITNLTQSGEQSVSNIKAHSANNWLIQMSNPQTPAELFALEKGVMRRLSTHQQEWLSNINLASVEGIQSKSGDGTLVSGIVYKPNGYVKGKKYPLVLYMVGLLRRIVILLI